MIEEILHLDRELFLYLNNLGGPGWDQVWLILSNKWSAIPIYAMLLLLCLKQLGLRRTLILAVAVALMVTTTDQLSNFLKYGVQRLRPCFDPEVEPFMRLVQESCGGKFGFYSAHAANTMGVAFLFTNLLKSPGGILGISLISWASLVGISRIFIGVHYPLDVLTGMLIGLLFSWLFARLYSLAIHKYHV